MNAEQVQVLIVEDSIAQAAQLKHILEKNGIAAATARNGREALQLLQGSQPDMILCDIVMPEMDGYEFCTRLKADPRCRDIPLVLLTSLSDQRSVIKGLMCGADNYLSKPYREERILARIGQVLAGAAARKGQPAGPVQLSLGDEHFLCQSGKQQILDFLLSTYEDTLSKHQELDDSYRKLSEAMATIKALEKKYRQQAISDELTGLYNRRGFFSAAAEKLQTVTAAGGAMGLFYFDLNKFKWINDTFGHAIGDQALRDAAELLQLSMGDTLGRLGGDEFAAAVALDKRGQAEKSCAALRNSLEQFNGSQQRPYQLSFSMGFAISAAAQPRSLDELIRDADQDMYRNKMTAL